MLERDGGIAEYAVGLDKWHLSGKLSITIAKNQYKFGDELIIQVYSKDKAVRKDRVNSNYNRIQVFMKIPEFEEMAKRFLERQGWQVTKEEKKVSHPMLEKEVIKPKDGLNFINRDSQ